MSPMNNRIVAIAAAVLVSTACSGGGSDNSGDNSGDTIHETIDKLTGDKIISYTSTRVPNDVKTLEGVIKIACALPGREVTLTLSNYAAGSEIPIALESVAMRFGTIASPLIPNSYTGEEVGMFDAMRNHLNPWSPPLDIGANSITYTLSSLAANVSRYLRRQYSDIAIIEKDLALSDDSVTTLLHEAYLVTHNPNETRAISSMPQKEVTDMIAKENRLRRTWWDKLKPDSTGREGSRKTIADVQAEREILRKSIAASKLGAWADSANANTLFLQPAVDGEWVFQYKAIMGTNQIVVKRASFEKVIKACS